VETHRTHPSNHQPLCSLQSLHVLQSHWPSFNAIHHNSLHITLINLSLTFGEVPLDVITGTSTWTLPKHFSLSAFSSPPPALTQNHTPYTTVTGDYKVYLATVAVSPNTATFLMCPWVTSSTPDKLAQTPYLQVAHWNFPPDLLRS